MATDWPPALTTIGGFSTLLDVASAQTRAPRQALLGFKSVHIQLPPEDKVVLPEDYTAKVLISWGDPVSDGPAFKPDASNSTADQSQQWGMHNDGLVYFPIDGSSQHGLLSENKIELRAICEDLIVYSASLCGVAVGRAAVVAMHTAAGTTALYVDCPLDEACAICKRWIGILGRNRSG